MLGVTLREEFRSGRIKGAAIELLNDASTEATRRFVITSDRGYAVMGYLLEAEGGVGQFIKKIFAGRCRISGTGDTGSFVLSSAPQVDNLYGGHIIALDCWMWRRLGGYPKLTRGSLALLEVISPFDELAK